MQSNREEKGLKVYIYIYIYQRKKEVNEQFGRKINQDVNGNKKPF